MRNILCILALLGPQLVSAAQQSPYSGQQTQAIKSLSPQEISALKNGDGMGFAKPAELNHYPGPKHVLELADELSLTPAQRAATSALYAQMKQKAVALGAELVGQEEKLDRLFSDQAIDAGILEQKLLEIGELRARLRNVHLQAHLRQREILDRAQIDRYDRLRGYHDPASTHTMQSHGHH